MNASTENSTEKALEKVSAEKPVSVYSVNFNRVINNFTEKKKKPGFLAKRKENAGAVEVQRPFSGKVFKWRNAVAVAAILAIGVFHFVFQMSFIRREVSENRPAVEAPPVKSETLKSEPVSVAPVETNLKEFDVKKIDAALPPRRSVPEIRQRPADIAPVKPPSKKKEGVETRAERLRRAERILTGI
jgi:hypothetical protein